MTHRDELRFMIAEYAHGQISEVRLRRLEAELREDDRLRAEFIEYMNIDAALGDHAALSESEIAQLDGTVTESCELANLDSGSSTERMAFVEPTDGSPLKSVANRGHWKSMAALVACLIVAVVSWWQFGTDAGNVDQIAQENDGAAETVRDVSRSTLATVVQLVDARWADSKPLAVGDRISPGVLRMQAGIVHLRFDNGVGVTLEGPSDFEVTSPEVTRLRSGLLTATVPPGAEGFRVDTPSAQVVDLGTAFGIDQRPDGTSIVSVFDGEVEIVSDDSNKRLLSEGNSIQLATDGSASDLVFTSQPFDRLWPTSSGIAGSSGAFRFTPPWPRGISRIQSDTEIFVLPEGYASELNDPCPIDISEAEVIRSRIPAGRRVRSYLLQFNPVDPTGQEANSKKLGSRMRRIEGSITFDGPVVGMIVTGETLKVTDEIFALRRGPIRPFARGLELNPSRTADVVSLSEDRRTVSLKLAVFNQFSDHVRVIVDASLDDGSK